MVKKGCERLGDRLADHLAQGIGVIGIKAHDRAVCILVKIPDRKGLHMLKHIVANPLKHALTNINHQPCIGKRSQHARKEDTA